MGFCTNKHGIFDELGQNRVPHPTPKLGQEEVKKKNMRLFSNSAVISVSVLQCETVESRWISDGAPWEDGDWFGLLLEDRTSWTWFSTALHGPRRVLHPRVEW